jgi:arsenite-transporting ATPase
MVDLCPVMLFSGKGGVGKTTLAAATAVHLVQSGARVLIVSTDPAHSLSDVFDYGLSGTPKQVMPGLDAMEVDAGGMFNQALGSGPGGEDDAPSKAIAKLVKLAAQTPGVDEFGAIEVLMAAVENAEHDVVILDTAPTGHTLRLLMLPELLDGWLGTLLSLRAQVAKAGRLLKRFLPKSARQADSIELEQGLKDGRERMTALRTLLTDPKKAQIFLVTIPEAMSILETLRTLEMLENRACPLAR